MLGEKLRSAEQPEWVIEAARTHGDFRLDDDKVERPVSKYESLATRGQFKDCNLTRRNPTARRLKISQRFAISRLKRLLATVLLLKSA
jgi:hypothetical protein